MHSSHFTILPNLSKSDLLRDNVEEQASKSRSTDQFSSPAGHRVQEDSSESAKTEDTAKEALRPQTIDKANSVSSRFLPWLARLAYPLGRYVLLPFYFRHIEVVGRENLPATGPVILAPTHRSRWDAFMVPYAAGQDVAGRELRFMVTADEVKGIQGWFIKHLGGFEINTKHPAISSLRHSLELLKRGEVLVMFPEGNIFRECKPLKPGLARLALQAESSQENLGIQIVPINIHYSQPLVPWRCSVEIRIGAPLEVAAYCSETPKQSAKQLTADLESAFKSLGDQTCGASDRN
jgi:1-acyl-sn-glycerol-3-phosphate acyltransferase